MAELAFGNAFWETKNMLHVNGFNKNDVEKKKLTSENGQINIRSEKAQVDL